MAPSMPRTLTWKHLTGEIVLKRTHVMGVLNVTPDSFSDGGRFLDPADVLGGGMVNNIQQQPAVHPQVHLLPRCVNVQEDNLVHVLEAVGVIFQQRLGAAVCVRLKHGPDLPRRIAQPRC